MAYSIGGRFFTNSGVPVAAPPSGYRKPDVMIDLLTSKAYEWKTSVWTEKPNFFGVANKSVASCAVDPSGNLIITYTDATTQNAGKVVGSTGATPILQNGNTTTLAFGNPASLTLRVTAPNTYAIDAAIPQGKDGTGGTGGQKFNYYTPDQFGTGAAAMQACLTAACADGLPIYSSGTYNCGNTVLTLPKQFNSLTWYGGGAKIICGGITRPRPANLTESQQQQNTKYTISDIQILGNGTGIGFEPAANSNSVFHNFQVSNFQTAGYFRTTQNGDIRNWSINNCVNGIIRDAESINGINPSQAQSNDTECHKIRMHVSNGFNMNICFGIYHSFGCHTYKTEVEGNAKVFRVFDIDNFGNNTVKELIAFEPHFEFTQGFTPGGCFAKVNLNAGIFKLISPNHDVGALAGMILIDASGSGVAAEMFVQDVNKWEHSGKIFINTNGNGCRWRLERGLSIIQYSANNIPTVEDNIKALFTNPIKWSGENFNQNPKVWGYSTFDWSMF